MALAVSQTGLPQPAAGQTVAARAASTPAAAGGAATTTPPTTPAATITFLDPTSSSVVVGDSSTLSAAVMLANAAQTTAAEPNLPEGKTPPANVEIKALLRSSKWKNIPTGAAQSMFVPPGVNLLQLTTTVAAERSDYPLAGVLVMREIGSKAKPSTMVLSAITLEDPGTADWSVVKSAGIAALAGILLGTVVLLVRLGRRALDTRMGPAGSSLAEGWSAALLIGGPFLTTAFTLAGFPDSPATMTKKTYLIVSFVLAIVIGVAPNIYGLYKAPTLVIDPTGKPTIQNQGLSGLFIISAWFTLTGCLGQLALLQLVFRDLTGARALSSSLGYAVDLLLLGLWSAVAIYGAVAVHNTVKSQYDLQTRAEDDARAAAEAKAEAEAKAAAEAAGRPAPLNAPAAPANALPAPGPALPGWSAL